MRAASLILLALVLTGCGMKIPFMVKADPYDAQCSPECEKECPQPITLTLPRQITPSADEAQALVKRDGEIFSDQRDVTQDQRDLCEARRGACHSCIERLKAAKVIK